MQFDEQDTDQRRPSPLKAKAKSVPVEAGGFNPSLMRTPVVLDEHAQGQRLDNFLARLLPTFPKSMIFRIIRSGEVRLNGARTALDQRLVSGQILRLPPAALAVLDGQANLKKTEKRSALVQGQAQSNARKLPILFEDEALLVLDKPAGLAVHGGSGTSLGVIESLRLARPEANFLELAHRLDKETSGLLVCAKKRVALVALQAQFRERVTQKTYQALVFGRLPKREKTVRLALSRDEETIHGDRRVRVDENGLSAVSIVKGLVHSELFAASHGLAPQTLSRVQVDIETGRTHQIRVHLSSLGYPIVGDVKYGDFELNRRLFVALRLAREKRMYLHAWRLQCRHPVSASTMRFEAPLPQEFLRLCPSE